ncbi:MAG TPA: RidA family protein [Caulobacteraceae bacterium]|jgi:enamine deaminase RidA (YjgF/YER057c/UK114 family)
MRHQRQFTRKLLDRKPPSGDVAPMQVLQPNGWPRPKGYANGVVAEGRVVVLAGMIGWNAEERFESDDLVEQVRQALANIRVLLGEAGARPEHLARLTWYLVDMDGFRARGREIGVAYREVLGRDFPPMAAVGVTSLVEARAKVEIEATAVIPFAEGR